VEGTNLNIDRVLQTVPQIHWNSKTVQADLVCPQNGNLPNMRTQVFYNSLKGTIQKAKSADIETGCENNPKHWESQPCQEALTSNKRLLFHLQLQK
jgi:hypothetical protein